VIETTRRSRRWVGPVAWSIVALTAALMILAEYLERSTGLGLQAPLLEDLLTALAFLSFPAMGALIASRRPDNAIGWLLLGIGLVAGLLVACVGYAAYGLVTNESGAPGATVAAWFEAWLWFPLIITIPTFLPLLFPTGRLPSRRWRPVGWITAALLAAVILPSMLEARLVGEGYNVPNPIGISSLGDTEEPLFAVLGPVLLFLIAVSLASIVFRYRRGSLQERQQLKWIALAVAVFLVTLILEEGFGLDIPALIDPLTLVALPVSVAIAVLKYRLYDIDRIISRTLAYTTLTVILAGGYLSLVLALRSLLPLQDGSPLIVAVSTLGVVAAFGPLRARVQRTMDHRFNRSRYDSARTIESFGAHLRQEVDLESLSRQLVDVVGETMHPAHVSLWFRRTEDQS